MSDKLDVEIKIGDIITTVDGTTVEVTGFSFKGGQEVSYGPSDTYVPTPQIVKINGKKVD